MVDTLTKAERSRRMGLVRSSDTGPEMEVRKLTHGLGYRFRLHRSDLPGKPDLVFPGRHKVIFVHGCFWHRHSDPTCKLARLPKSRLEFWIPKLEANAERDRRNEIAIERLGWNYMTIWECELQDRAFLEGRIRSFLGS